MRKLLIAGIVILMIAIVTATVALFLFPYQPNQPSQTDDTGSTQQGIQEVVNANNQFAFDLYSELYKSEQGNVFYSPYSISAALAMTYEGAKGQTADEMKSVFHFPESKILRPNFAAVYNEINKQDKNYKLSTGNALWVQKDYPFLEDYIKRVENYYGGKAAGLDFIQETEKSRQTINTFIEEQTNDKIKDLIAPGVLNPMTRMVLTNAIYFKGTWEWGFDKSDTRDMDFKITKDNIIKTPMMYMNNDKASFNYADIGELQILELPYKDNEISMLILLPKQGVDYDMETGEEIILDYTLEDIELTTENLNSWKSEMQDDMGRLDSIYLPKFEFDTKYGLNQVLTQLGMPTAFNEMKADFSGMTQKEQLFISNVIHQAYVKVDEKGTEAAAATAVVMEASGIGSSNIFKADHPFIFIIQEKETGNVLFMGRMINPTQ